MEAEVEDDRVDAVPLEDVDTAPSAASALDPSWQDTVPCNLPQDFCLLLPPVATPCRGLHDQPLTVEQIDLKIAELQRLVSTSCVLRSLGSLERLAEAALGSGVREGRRSRYLSELLFLPFQLWFDPLCHQAPSGASPPSYREPVLIEARGKVFELVDSRHCWQDSQPEQNGPNGRQEHLEDSQYDGPSPTPSPRVERL